MIVSTISCFHERNIYDRLRDSIIDSCFSFDGDTAYVITWFYVHGSRYRSSLLDDRYKREGRQLSMPLM